MLSEVPEGWVASKPIAYFVDNVGKKWDGKSKALYVGLEHIAQSEGRLVAIGDTDGIASAKSAFEKCDVLFGKLRPNLRKFWYADTSGVCSTDILVLRAKQGLLPKYLFFLTQSTEFIGCAVQDAVGTKMPRTSWKSLGAQRLPIPPLTEQKRIAEVLSSVDESIQATQRLIEQAERVKQGLMEELLTGGLGSEAIERGEVPEGWSNTTLTEISVIAGEYGANASKEEFSSNLPRYIRITDIKSDGTLDDSVKVSLNEKKAAGYELEHGDIVLARSGATVGKSFVYDDVYGRCVFAGYLLRFRLDKDKAYFGWLKHWLKSSIYWDWVENNQRAGAQPNINAKEYGGMLLALPPLNVQKQIADRLSSIDILVFSLRESIEAYGRIKSGLMDDLLTGKVRTV